MFLIFILYYFILFYKHKDTIICTCLYDMSPYNSMNQYQNQIMLREVIIKFDSRRGGKRSSDTSTKPISAVHISIYLQFNVTVDINILLLL